MPCPNLLFLAFLVFLAFFLFKEFLAILSVFPSFPRILGVRQAEEILAFLVVFLAVFQNGKEKKIRVSLSCLRAMDATDRLAAERWLR